MYLYKQLSDTDIALKPEAYGIFNKKVIEEVLLKFLQEYNEQNTNKAKYSILYKLAKRNDKEYVSYCLKNILIETTNEEEKIKNAFDLENIEELYKSISAKKNLNKSITNYLSKKEDTNTKWISFTNDINKAIDNYNINDNHQVALIDSNIISTININDEYLRYNYVPNNNIYILKPLMIDMLYNDMIDLESFNNINELKIFNYQLLSTLIDKFKDSDNRLLSKHLIDEIYINNKNLKNINIDNMQYEKLLQFKKICLDIINEEDNNHIKKLNKEIILPEKNR